MAGTCCRSSKMSIAIAMLLISSSISHEVSIAQEEPRVKI
jgi:hypothetical protein